MNLIFTRIKNSINEFIVLYIFLYLSLLYISIIFLNNKIKLSFISGKACLIAPMSKHRTSFNIDK